MTGNQWVSLLGGRSGRIGRINPTYAYARVRARARDGIPLKAGVRLYLKLSQISSLTSLSSHEGKKGQEWQGVDGGAVLRSILPQRGLILPILPCRINILWGLTYAHHILRRGQ